MNEAEILEEIQRFLGFPEKCIITKEEMLEFSIMNLAMFISAINIQVEVCSEEELTGNLEEDFKILKRSKSKVLEDCRKFNATYDWGQTEGTIH